MTGLLHDVLHEHAEHLTPHPVDLDAVIRTGDRRVARRRWTGGLVAAAVAASIAGTAAGLSAVQPRADGPVATPPAPAAFAQRQPGYALGPVIHAGTRSWRMPRPVVSYVQTDDGFVWTSKDGTVWLFDGTDAAAVGSTSNQRLRADDTGSLVAWAGTADDGHPQYVVYDTSRRAEVARVDDAAVGTSRLPEDRGSEVFALDDGKVYWRADADRIVRYDVATGDTSVTYDPPDAADPVRKPARVYGIADVAAGRIAFLMDGPDGSLVTVGDAVDGALPIGAGGTGDLSADGTYFMQTGDKLFFWDTSTREGLTLGHPAAYRTGLGWLDDVTAVVLEFPDLEGEPTKARLETCDVSARRCSDAGTVDFPATDPESFVAPTGDPTT